MTARQRLALPGLMSLPLALIVVPTLLLRSLLPASVSTMWPAVAVLMAAAGFVTLSVVVHEWTRSFASAALATIASVGLTLLGIISLLFWAVTGTTLD
jgi:hypothetical protein